MGAGEGPTPPNEPALAQLGERIDGRVPPRARRRRRRRRLRLTAYVATGLVLVLVGVAGAAYYYGYLGFKAAERPLCTRGKIQVCRTELPGAPFNVLVIGSDSRGGLPASDDKYFGGPGAVSGQRSDVVKIFHVDPTAGTISVVSIPRDTMVSLLANKSLFGSQNRINVNFQNGPQLLVQTIEANFGIPINHVVQIDFGGLVDAVNDVGGVWMYFPYPALDLYSSLDIPHTGCQRLNGFQALAVARSRHFQYLEGGYWQYDGTSDFGRIDRQNQFLRALVQAVERDKYDPLQIASFLHDLPKGLELDNTFNYNQLLSIAWRFHTFNPNTLAAYTLPVVGAVDPAIGDVLYVDQPAAQQLLVRVFGQVGTRGGLYEPPDPPPNIYGATPPPPVVVLAHHVRHHTTTTTAPLHTEPQYTFNPLACTPR
jgi:LCP family protein required for cell wall assembly